MRAMQCGKQCACGARCTVRMQYACAVSRIYLSVCPHQARHNVDGHLATEFTTSDAGGWGWERPEPVRVACGDGVPLRPFTGDGVPFRPFTGDGVPFLRLGEVQRAGDEM